MYFIIDGILLALLICVFVFGIKKGLTGNWIFNILRTVIAFAGGIGAAAGVYFLMDRFGWLTAMSKGVISFFGNIRVNYGIALDDTFRMVCKIVAFIPFAVLFCVLGYILVYWLLGLVLKILTVPLGKLREVFVWKVIDNVLGCIFNLALLVGVTLVIFGVIHGLNTGDTYTHILGAGALPNVNHSIEIVLDNMHENLSAGVISGFLYEHNPLNGMFVNLI